ncbi:RHS repeat domain-containing protein [Planctomycetota bacterium]
MEESSSLVAEYNYDAFDRRVERNVDAGDHLLYYYDGSEVIEEYNDSNVLQRRYVYGASIDEPLVLEESTKQDDPLYYYHTNALGTVMSLTNDTGDIVERYEYSAYGELTILTNDANVNNPYHFTGRRYDPETEKYYYCARYYDPATGRFLTHDPEGMDFFGSLYAYVSNNPVNMTDPFGLSEEEEDTAPTGETFSPSKEKYASLSKYDYTVDVDGNVQLWKNNRQLDCFVWIIIQTAAEYHGWVGVSAVKNTKQEAESRRDSHMTKICKEMPGDCPFAIMSKWASRTLVWGPKGKAGTRVNVFCRAEFICVNQFVWDIFTGRSPI